ncbi:hypothetical protein BG015_002884 [Linnemannia schmuckeri]|uniref:Uncharacterized protein n=1 Tax=Linnemannia schmuckeri TaxID=64567 RepID=A0A9P5S6Z7_9FUNG|nr:hypothetical protein BG015_002884 [Linnemannia schmuckeri]
MQDLDPASLLFIPRDEYAPLQLDPELFESVGDGVSLKTFVIPKVSPPGSTSTKSPLVAASSSLERLKSLAVKFNPQDGDALESLEGGGGERQKSNRSRMSTIQSWDVAWEQDLDQRVLEIDRSNIFDSFHAPGTASVFDVQEASPSPVSSEQGAGVSEVDLFTESMVGSTSYSAGLTSSPLVTKETLSLTFDLPVLSKRPRNILDDCVLRDHNPVATANKYHQQPTAPDDRVGKVAKIQTSKSKTNAKEDRSMAWRAAGKPIQEDLTGATYGEHGTRVQEQLSWETCSKSGPRTVSSHLVMSPYVTEAGTTIFESVYQRHMDYAFKFRPSPTVVPYKKLIEGGHHRQYSLSVLIGGDSKWTQRASGSRGVAL